MEKRNLLTRMLLLFALIVGSTSVWADTVTKWVKTEATSLVTGDVVVIVDQNTTKALSNTCTSAAPSATAVTLNTTKTEISSEVSSTLQWDVTVSTSGSTKSYQFSITSGSSTNYLTVTNTNNGVRLGSSTDRCSFTIATGGDNNCDYLYNVSGSDNRYIGVYNSQDWRCYTTINNNIKATVTTFYKKIEEEVAETAVTLSFPAAAYSATIGESFTAPTLTVTPSAYDGTIGYSSSDENVATVGADGTITLVGVGVTTITATAPATANYQTAETSYTLTVKNPIADGVFDFTGTEDYGSGAVLGTTYSTDKVFTAGNITLTAKGNYNWYSGEPNTLRIYSGGTAVIAAPDGYNITKIEVTGAALTKGTIDGNAFTNDTEDEWTGEAQTVTIARGSATIQLKTITVTYEQAVERVEAELSFGATTTFNVNVGEGDDFEAPTLTTATGFDGTVTYDYESTNDANTVVLDSSTGEIMIEANAEGTVTVTAASEATSKFKAGTASYTINIVDSRSEAGLAWSKSEVDIELDAADGEYTLPTLTNPNNVTVTYSSSNEDVAVVDDTTGEVVVETSAEGTATITATFAGNSTYKPATVSYTITISDPNARDGSVEHPYNVADIIEGVSNTSGIYVKGFIVGSWYNNQFAPDNLQNTNLALADTPDETDGSKTIPVELKSSFRPSFGLTDGGKAYNIGVAQVLIQGNAKSYFSVNGVKELNSITKVAEQVSITAAGMATYYTDCALDFTDINDIYAYTATVSGDAITFNRVRKVPANTGVLLRNPNETAASQLVPVTDTPENVTSVFVGTLEDIAALASEDGSYVNYILNNGSQGVGFYKANDQSLGAHKAYLHVSENAARSFIGFAEDETTGISALLMNGEHVNSKVYNLNGQRVVQPSKGLYIVNGKKVVIK